MSANIEGVPFEINIVGDESGDSWLGRFRAKEKVTFQDQLSADRMKRELLGPNIQDANGDVYAQVAMVSELSVRLTEWPKWWTEMKGGLLLTDFNVLAEVYKKCVDIREEYMKRVQKKGEQAKEKLAVEEK